MAATRNLIIGRFRNLSTFRFRRIDDEQILSPSRRCVPPRRPTYTYLYRYMYIGICTYVYRYIYLSIVRFALPRSSATRNTHLLFSLFLFSRARSFLSLTERRRFPESNFVPRPKTTPSRRRLSEFVISAKILTRNKQKQPGRRNVRGGRVSTSVGATRARIGFRVADVWRTNILSPFENNDDDDKTTIRSRPLNKSSNGHRGTPNR